MSARPKRDFTVWYDETVRMYVMVEAGSAEEAERIVVDRIVEGEDPEGDFFSVTDRAVVDVAPASEDDEGGEEDTP